MNQRLYKAKADHNGEWVFGYYLEVDGVSYILPEGKPLNAIVQVRPETVCQEVWSCVRDVFGRNVFEDDIVKKRGKDGSEHVGVVTWGIFKRGKHRCAYGFALKDKSENKWELSGYIEVVGNIHDKEKPHA